MGWAGPMESVLHESARHVALALQAIAMIIVAIGSVRAVVGVVRLVVTPKAGEVEGRVVSLQYGRWLIAGLTFQLAADVVGTSFSPSWQEVGRLAAVAAIRTFLSYFLDHEMERTQRVAPAGAPPDPPPEPAPSRP